MVKVMDMKILLAICIAVAILIGLFACRFAEIVSYEHELSKIFYENLDYDILELNSFISEDILFVVDVKQVTHEEYIIWLELYTKLENKKVNINRAIIQGNGWKQEEIVNSDLLLNENTSQKELLKKSLKLFQIKGDLLEKVFSDGGDLWLKVLYSTANDEGEKKFILKRKVEKQSVFPT